MACLIKNASEILTMNHGLGLIKNSSILIDDGLIKEIGPIRTSKEIETIDAQGGVVCPGFVDSHTHLVFVGSRADEFALRLSGVGYEKIAKMGGGIQSTVRKTRAAPEQELYELACRRITNLIRHGTTTIEIKSGYGLSCTAELKILKIVRRLQENLPVDIIPTFLVHAIPPHMKRRDYVDLVIEEMIPAVVREDLAVFCDIFCDKTAFTKKESEKILLKAKRLGLKLKIHADELANSGGGLLAAKLGCVSADHLIHTPKGSIKKMKDSDVIPCLLPGTSLYLNTKKKPNIKVFKKLNAPVALASDYNPGTCMIYSMPRIISLACLLYRMDIEDALIGATKNGAKALALADRIGTIEIGKQADLVILNVENYRQIPYQFGEDMVMCTIKRGKVIYGENC